MLSEIGPAPTIERAYRALMAGHLLRPLRAADLAAACELLNRADAAEGVPRVLSESELAEELESIDLDTDSRAIDLDGLLAGLVYTYHLPSEVGQERCYLFGATDPSARGRGVGRALLAWGVERGREQLRSTGRDLPRYLRVDRDERVEDAHRLYARFGFRPVRWFEELVRPLDGLPPLPDRERAPGGVRIVPWPDDRDDDVREAKNAAFADHWGSTPTSSHHWAQMTRGFGARADLSFVALDAANGDVVGHCLCKRFDADDEVVGRRQAWIDNLGTRREWRGRGIASALIVHALRAFRADGLSHAAIGVDADNPSGAAGLYRSLGFVPVRRSLTHEIGC